MCEKVYLVTAKSVNPASIRGVVYKEDNAKALYLNDSVDHHFKVTVEDSRMENYVESNLEACDCKYYSPKLKAILSMIHALYEIDGCCCGGICHIVTDDDNYDDDDLDFVINECHKEENKDRLELELAEAICIAMKKLSMPERALLFSGFYGNCLCDSNHECKNCCIEKGEKIY